LLNKDKQYFDSIGINPAVLALSIARMAEAIGNSVLFILLPLYVAKLPSQYLGFSTPILVGILISSYGLIASVVQPVMGAVSDRLGSRKRMIQGGITLMGMGTLGFILAEQYFHLFALRVVQGIGVAITIPASMALMAAITKRSTRGGSMGAYSMLRMIGFASGPVIGGFLQTRFGFNTAFYVGAGFLFLAVLLVQIWVKDVPVNSEILKERFRIFDRSLLSPGILAASLSTFMMATTFSMVTTLENEFNQKLGIDAFGFSIAFSSMMIGRIFLQIPLGRLSDKIGRKPVILIGLIILAATTVLLGEVNTLAQMITVRIIQGLASAGIAAPALALVADLSRIGGEGRQMAVITTSFGLGIAIGPLMAGFLAALFFELPFITGGIMAFVAALVVLRLMPETVTGEKVLFKSHQID
jgi:MFS family permease